MLSGCPDLNSLTMGYSSGFHQFKINALKLKYVEMYFHGSDADRLQELIVENASCLETLHHKGPYEDNMHISIITFFVSLRVMTAHFDLASNVV